VSWVTMVTRALSRNLWLADTHGHTYEHMSTSSLNHVHVVRRCLY
jgi:hypothetical protein